jgi:hypothetical protein
MSFFDEGDTPRDPTTVQGMGTKQLFHDHPVGSEGGLQHIDGQMRLSFAAHEDVERGVADLGPTVDADMALR